MEKIEKLRRSVYLLVIVVLMLQYFIPILVAAETLELKNTDFELISLEAGAMENELLLTISTKRGSEDQKFEVQYSSPIIDSATSVDGNIKVYLDQENQNMIISNPTHDTKRHTIMLTIDPNAQTNGEHLTVQNGLKLLTYNFNSIVETVGTERQEADQSRPEITDGTSGANQKYKKVSSDETDFSSEAQDGKDTETTTSASEKKSEAQGTSARDAAAQGTDIRSYFPNGEGTILTDANTIFTDADGVPIAQPLPIDANIKLSYQWAIPESVREQIKVNDTFTFKFPDEIKPNRAYSGELKNSAGETYGEYVVDLDGNVTFTFNENVTNQSDITGNFMFDSHLDQEEIDRPGHHEIVFPEEDQLPPIDIDVRPDTTKEIDKQGKFNQKMNPSSIEWTVDVNQSMTDRLNSTITENWPAGVTFDSVKVYELTMNLDGTVQEVARELASDEYTVNENGDVTIKGETNKAYRVIYQSSIDDNQIPDEGGTLSFLNKATFSDDNDQDGVEAQDSLTAEYGKLLTKKDGAYNKDDQSFDWEIDYNYGEKHLSKDQATLTDETSSNLIFEEDSLIIYPTTFDENGRPQKGIPLIEGMDYTLVPADDGHGFVLKFANDIDQSYTIQYKTKVDGIVEENTDVSNKVTTSDGQYSETGGTATQQNVIKNLGAVDYLNRTADWSIQLNANRYMMEDLIFNDSYTPQPGLTLAVDAQGNPQLTITDIDANKELVLGTDYTLLIATDNESNETGFQIAFIGDYQQTDHAFQIAYQTNFDVSEIDPNDPSMDRFVNHAEIAWDASDGGQHQSSDDQDFKPNYSFSLNAEKSGQYNAVDKTITWRIAVNLSGNPLVSAKLIDTIHSNQRYVEDSLSVYEALTSTDGTVSKKDEEADNDRMVAIIQPGDSNNQTFEVDFPENDQQTYIIEFKTSLEGTVIEDASAYTNTAQYENNGDSRDVVGKVEIKNGGSLLAKSGEVDERNPDIVHWHMMINPSQSLLDNVVIEDTPSSNQVITEDSVAIYQTKVAEDGSLTPDMTNPLVKGQDYTVEIDTDNLTGEQKMTIQLIGEIDQAYYVDYQSFVTSSVAGNKDTVTNQATIKADNIDEGQTTDPIPVEVQVDHSSGNADGKKGKIVLQKTDADGVTPLVGAHFQLMDHTMTQVLREGTVDELGRITFGALPLGEYRLIETQAPEGYTISDELANGMKVQITQKNTEDQVAPLNIKNEKNQVVIRKVDATGTAITHDTHSVGAAFTLEKYNFLAVSGSNWETVSLNPNSTDEKGELRIVGLPVGLYRLTEISAPTGFIVNQKPTHFFVTKNSKNQVNQVNVTFTNYQGAAELRKVDDQGQGLNGATFSVFNDQNEEVQKGLISDEEGHIKVEGLAPGRYYFKETSAPVGSEGNPLYILNEDTGNTAFEIPASASGAPVTVTQNSQGQPLTLVNYQGSAQMKKVDQAGDPLGGAAFNLYLSSDTNHDSPINTAPIQSDDKGDVYVSGLAPGSYDLVETRAPDGYIKNTTTISFTIDEASTGEPKPVLLDPFINYQGSFSLRKVDTSNTPLSGAEFTLYDSNKQSLHVVETSDDQGIVAFKDLAPGTYYFQETKAPENENGQYIINTGLFSFTIQDEGSGEPDPIYYGDFQNFLGRAEITKVGEGGSIAGATFTLNKIVDGEKTFVKSLVVDDKGAVDLSDLTAGSYQLIETKAAPGYILNLQPIVFMISENEDELEPDAFDFPNYQSEITGKKVDDQGNGLAGAVFEIYAADDSGASMGEPLTVYDQTGKETKTIVSDTSGAIYAKGLEVGQYLLVETVSPDGYILDSTPSAFTIEAQLGDPEIMDLGDFVNYQGSFKMKKTDNQGTGLAGAAFNLYQVEDLNTPLNSAPLVSDDEGWISFDGLTPGDYRIVETEAPEGYLLNTEEIDFTVSASEEGRPGAVEIDSFINYQGTAKLVKENAAGEKLYDAVFNVYLQSDQAFAHPVAENLVSDQEGVVTVAGLAPGTYVFKEIKAPKEYLVNTELKAFTIGSENAGAPDLVDAGTLIDYQGAVQLQKVDDEKNGLAGSVFDLVNSEGQTVQSVTSDEHGWMRVDQLAPGSYLFRETKAPNGYLINTETVTFEISDTAVGRPEVLDLGSFENYSGEASLEKVNEAGQPLAGASFNVVNDVGAVVNETPLVSDAHGLVWIDELAPGNYYFVETDAPKGYQLSQEKRAFAIPTSAEGVPKVVSVGTFKNILIPDEPTTPTDSNHSNGKYPQTNEQPKIWPIIFGGILILFVFLVLSKRYRRKPHI